MRCIHVLQVFTVLIHKEHIKKPRGIKIEYQTEAQTKVVNISTSILIVEQKAPIAGWLTINVLLSLRRKVSSQHENFRFKYLLGYVCVVIIYSHFANLQVI